MILIVDDDKAIRLSIGLMLRQAGMEFTAVATEQETLEAVRSGEVSLVILDMNLSCETSGRDGIELLRKIKVLKPEIPVIMLSAWGTVPLAVEGMNFGAVDFVTKPWTNREFMARIRKALDAAKAASEAAAEADTVETLDDAEKSAIIKALRQADGNMSIAAQNLGITRQSLYRRMEKFGIK